MKKVFEKIIEAIRNAGGCDGNCEYDRGWDDAIREAETIVEKIVSDHNNGWIPVEERLPRANKVVLCCADDGGIDIDFLRKTTRVFSVAAQYNKKVVAWQPLLEAYKG